MTVITTKLMVSPDGSVSLADAIPPGEHTVRVELDAPQPQARLDYQSFPRIDVGPWPAGLSLRREDLYGDDGR